MRYVCLFYGDEEKLTALPASEWESLQIGCMDYDRRLKDEGYLLLAQPLESTREAKNLRVRRRKATVKDGPFAETKEQLLGFILIEVPDEEKAIELASFSPLAALGITEVRPAMTHPSTEALTTGSKNW